MYDDGKIVRSRDVTGELEKAFYCDGKALRALCKEWEDYV